MPTCVQGPAGDYRQPAFKIGALPVDSPRAPAFIFPPLVFEQAGRNHDLGGDGTAESLERRGRPDQAQAVVARGDRPRRDMDKPARQGEHHVVGRVAAVDKYQRGVFVRENEGAEFGRKESPDDGNRSSPPGALPGHENLRQSEGNGESAGYGQDAGTRAKRERPAEN